MSDEKFPVAPGTKPVNTGTVRNGKLDEKLSTFRTMPISEKEGIIVFQFETGGFTLALKSDMHMSDVADKLEATARRVRQYQERGWPDSAPTYGRIR